MCKISCDICKYGESHDYVDGNYYCRHKDSNQIGDRPMVSNCKMGEIDEWKYNLKYKPFLGLLIFYYVFLYNTNSYSCS